MSFYSLVIPEFLTPSELDTIVHTVEANQTEVNTYYDHGQGAGHNAVTQGFFLWMPQYQPIAKILLPKFWEQFGPDIKLDTCHILNSYVPYGIHTDVLSAGFDPNGPDLAAWTFIIPLDNYNSHTVVFEQKHETIKTLNEWVQATSPEPHAIDDQFHQRYLTHTDRLDLQWLTPETVFAWRRGALFAADRRKFHTSDDFPSRGLSCKRAIVIWSTMPKNKAP